MAKRYIEFAWKCDRYGHITPSQKFGKDGKLLSITSSGGKRVLIDKLRTAQISRKGKWTGQGCYASRKTTYPSKDVCSDQSNSYPTCEGEANIEMTKDEYLSFNDMTTASPRRCIAIARASNECKSNNYKRCFNACKSKCEETKLTPTGLYDFQKLPYSNSNKIINYYKKISRESRKK